MPQQKQDAMYRGASHDQNGIKVAVGEKDSAKEQIEVEGLEYKICREAYDSDVVLDFGTARNKDILDYIHKEFSCTFIQPQAQPSDFIICKKVVFDPTPKHRKGTVKEVLNQMQGEGGCKVVDEKQNKFEQGGSTWNKFKDGGLLAPNGKKSNLTPEQYKLVRTPSFKKWFGDWEKSPKDASKVVDENGEPLVVYHQTNNNDFYIFDNTASAENKHRQRFKFIFVSTVPQAFVERKFTLQFFVNLRNVFSTYDKSAVSVNEYEKKIGLDRIEKISKAKQKLLRDVISKNATAIINEWKRIGTDSPEDVAEALENKNKPTTPTDLIWEFLFNWNDGWSILEQNAIIKFIETNGYDSFVTKEEGLTSFGIKDKTQIKLADGSNKTFDGNNPDIRFEAGGEITDLTGTSLFFVQQMVDRKLARKTLNKLNEKYEVQRNGIQDAIDKGYLTIKTNPIDRNELWVRPTKKLSDRYFEAGGTIIKKGVDGDCYKNVQDYLLENDLPHAVIVHGAVTNSAGKTMKHAWIENDGDVIDATTGVITPKENYYEKLKPHVYAKYDFAEALKLRFATKNYGEWTKEEVQKTIGSDKKFESGGTLPTRIKIIEGMISEQPDNATLKTRLKVLNGLVLEEKKESLENELDKYGNEKSTPQELVDQLAGTRTKEKFIEAVKRGSCYGLSREKIYEVLGAKKENTFDENLALVGKYWKGGRERYLAKKAKWKKESDDFISDMHVENIMRMAEKANEEMERQIEAAETAAPEIKYPYKENDAVTFFGVGGKRETALVRSPSVVKDGIQIWLTSKGYVAENQMLPSIFSAKKESSGGGYKAFKGIGGGTEYRVVFEDGDKYTSYRAADREEAIIEAMRHRLYSVKDYPKTKIVHSVDEMIDSISDKYLQKKSEPETTPFELDKKITAIKSKYKDELARIIDLPKAEQRASLIEWIKEPTNQTKVIIAFSGGKDSVAMVLYSLFVLNIPKENIELWHHEVDGGGEKLFDWACTHSYCVAFAKAFGLTILFSYAKGGILREMYRENETIQPVFFQKEMDGQFFELLPVQKEKFKTTKRKFPAVSPDLTARWCSWIAKIGVMNKAINHTEKYKHANLVVMTGERRLESTARSHYDEIEKYRGFTSTRRAVTWRPIIDFTDAEVWAIMEKHKVQPHPCYELGWGRCSCQICIFGNANVWKTIDEISPDKTKRVAEIEKDLKFTLYSTKKKGVQIQESIFDAKVNKGISFLTEEAKKRWLPEALGEFVSPIIVDDWKMPLGALSNETSGAT